MLIMCIILITEAIIEPKTRLTWPYGDLVPGGYIVKVSLPLFCVLVAIAVSYKNKVGFLSGIIALLTIVVSVLTGERTTYSSSMRWYIIKFNLKPVRMLSILILIEILAVVFVMNVRPDLKKSFGENSLSIMLGLGLKMLMKNNTVVLERRFTARINNANKRD